MSHRTGIAFHRTDFGLIEHGDEDFGALDQPCGRSP
jgi:hypothetical protein